MQTSTYKPSQWYRLTVEIGLIMDTTVSVSCAEQFLDTGYTVSWVELGVMCYICNASHNIITACCNYIRKWYYVANKI